MMQNLQYLHVNIQPFPSNQASQPCTEYGLGNGKTIKQCLLTNNPGSSIVQIHVFYMFGITCM